VQNFYWIDCVDRHDELIKDALIGSIKDVYDPIAKDVGVNIHLVDGDDITVGCGQSPFLDHPEHGDLLSLPGKCYVSSYHPDAFANQLLEIIYRQIDSSKMELVNRVEGFPLIEKDKLFGLTLASKLNFPLIPSVIANKMASECTIDEIAEKRLGGYPLIYKPNDLFAGIGIQTIENRSDYVAKISNPLSGRPHLLQKKIDIVTDYRVYLVDAKVVSCQARFPVDGKGLANVTQGASSEFVTAPESISGLSEQMAKELKARYLCVDWLYDGSTYFYSEIETAGGFSGLPETERRKLALKFFKVSKNGGKDEKFKLLCER